MEDIQISNHIKNLTLEEERLWAEENLNDNDVQKLHRIQHELDQCWDLLRQRRALRGAGKNPDKAEPRDIDTIENYQD